ncbi:hypothetical protein ACFY30_22905 [Streptomyces sp. NPDC000345]|uniref:hypothetical protein n=1 Tax=Streptomyces sp. NPDC000345 TaxID=3364537 RepID=UPI0036C63D9E
MFGATRTYPSFPGSSGSRGDGKRDTGSIITLLEAAPALVLFTDAMTVRRHDLAVGGFLPTCLPGIGLPLSIGAGSLLAWPLLPGPTGGARRSEAGGLRPRSRRSLHAR